MIRLVYETHSITVDNETGFATGWLPGELSAEGIVLARELGVRRRDDGVDAVFCSDLRRATQTAEEAFGGTEIPVFEDARLRETNYGDFNGMPTSQLHAEKQKYVNSPYPNGESWRQAVERTIDFLDSLYPEWDGKRIVVIAHASQRYAFRELAEGIPLATLVDAPFEWREGWEYHWDPDSRTLTAV